MLRKESRTRKPRKNVTASERDSPKEVRGEVRVRVRRVRAGPAGGRVRGALRKLFSLREGEPAGPGEWSSSRSQGCA